MKKIVLILLTILLAASLTLTFTACKSNCAKGEHDMQLSSTTEATCTADKVEHYKCANCTHTEDRVVADTKLGHDFANGSVITETPATCKGAGSKTVKCARCNETQTSSVGEQTDHSYKAGEYENANDQHWQECEYNCGTTTQKTNCTYTYAKKDATHHTATCSVCHNAVDKPHSWVKNGAEIPATCEHGTITNYKCSDCNETKQDEADDKLNHNFNVAGAIVDQPTCTTVGTRSYKCATCSQTETRADAQGLPAIGHDFDTSTWTHKDGQHWHACNHGCTEKQDLATCSHQFKSEYSNATEHWGVCSVCGDVTAHEQHNSDTVIQGEPAKCYKDGKTDGKACSVCKRIMEEQQTISKTTVKHDWAWIYGENRGANHQNVDHYMQCQVAECRTITLEGAHNLQWCQGDANDTTHHWKTCECGYADTSSKELHSYGDNLVCSKCEKVAENVVYAVIIDGETTAHRVETSLQDAVNLVKAGQTATIYMGKDMTGGGVIVPSDSNITFRFNNHTYTIAADGALVGSTGTETNCFQLLRGSNVKFINGTIKSENPSTYILIQNYANLTLDNVNLDASNNNAIGYALSNNCGNVVITNGSKITASTNHVAFDVYYNLDGNYSDGVSVTVNEGCLITGIIEYGADVVTDGWQSKTVLSLPNADKNYNIKVNSTDCESAYITIEGTRLTHREVTDAATAPSCTETGLTEGKHCSVCGKVTVAQTSVPASGHSWGEWGGNTATCTSTGTETRKCTVCQSEEHRDTVKLDHSYTRLKDTVPATCTHNEVKIYQCATCTATEERETPNSAMGHDYDTEWTVLTVDGTEMHVHKCKRESCTEYDTTTAHAVNFGEWGGNTATCETGGKEHRECTCGVIEERDTDPLGHNVTTAKYIGNKKHQGICANCGGKVDVACDNAIDDKAAPCTVCGHQRNVTNKTATIVIKNLPNFESGANITEIKSGDIVIELKKETATTAPRFWSTNELRLYAGNKVSISVQNTIISEIVFTASTNMTAKVDSGSYNNGKWTGNSLKIVFEVSNKPVITEIAITYEVCGHYWDDGEVTSAGDCTTDGEKEYTCLDCGETRTETVKATGHQYSYHEANIATTEHAGNRAYYSCENCDLFFDGEDKTVEIERDSWIIDQLSEKCHHADAKWIMLDNREHFLYCSNCGYSTAKCNGELTHTPNNDGTHIDRCEKADCEYSVNNVKCQYDTENDNDGKCICGYKGLIEITLTLTNVKEDEVTLYENDTDKVIELTNGKVWVARGTKIRVEADADEIKYNGNDRAEIDNILYVLTDKAENVEITVVSQKSLPALLTSILLKTGKNNSTNVDTSDLNKLKGNTDISFTTSTKIFGGTDSIKMGSSSAVGVIEFNLPTAIDGKNITITKVVFNVAKYGSDSYTFKINGSSKTPANDKVEYEVTKGTTSIKFESAERAYLSSIEFIGTYN